MSLIERLDEARRRSIHDEEVQVMREKVAGGWVSRAKAKALPVTGPGRPAYKPMDYEAWARMTFTDGD